MKQQYIAHIRDSDQAIQTIREHDEGVAELGASFSITPFKNIVYNSGILHDIGKYQKSFQERIRGRNIRVDHSTCGAIEAEIQIKYPASLIMEYIISGHHSGIPNGGNAGDLPGEGKNGNSLSARLKKGNLLEDYSMYKTDGLLQELRKINIEDLARELAKDCCKDIDKLIDKYAFIVRFCFSCLVDADSLDTEYFCRQIERETLHSDFKSCLDDINKKFDSFICTTSLQNARSSIQKQAYTNINKSGEIYMMNMPTGSGKTLCGTKCALMKAIAEHKKHIIYVIPYNSIITQTSDELSAIFKEDAHILRHQSTYMPEDDENLSDVYKIRVQRATENWDADIIITTMVQFFETTFSNKRAKLRKMHNMANSVLIFDEAHLMPLEYLQPCLETIVYFTRYANCSAVFLTATMPDYEQLLKTYTFKDVQVVDLVPDKTGFQYFEKCIYQDLGTVTESGLFSLCQEELSVLLVVNARETAKKIYNLFAGDDNRLVFHLSTYMTKADIRRTITSIKEELSLQAIGTEKRKITVISTSLIEAGVDLDFYTVYREYAGLDNILQAGGRCNREGKRKYGHVYVFGLENVQTVDSIRTAVTKSLTKEYEDISAPECVKDYFNRVYLTNQKEITKNAMHNFCRNISSIPFADYDGEIIQNSEQSIVIPESEEAEQLIAQLQYAEISKKLMRQLQKYTCSVPMHMFNELLELGVLEDYDTGVYTLTNMDYYDLYTGIHTEGRDYFI